MIQLEQVKFGYYNWAILENDHNNKSANMSFEEPLFSLNTNHISKKFSPGNDLVHSEQNPCLGFSIFTFIGSKHPTQNCNYLCQ